MKVLVRKIIIGTITAGWMSTAAVTGPVAAAPQATPSASQHHVIAVRHHADGSTSETIWMPAPGVTVTQLYESLKTEGTPGLVDPAAGTHHHSGTDEAECSISGAYALKRWCVSPRWSPTPGFVRPQLYFLDHTSAAWPVSAAAQEWNAQWGIDVWWRWHTSGCPAGAHCSHVYNGSYGSTWLGKVDYAYDASRFLTRMTVYLNDSNSTNDRRRRVAACHELGHGTGLDHNLFKTSCLYSLYSDQVATLPDWNDLDMLEWIY